MKIIIGWSHGINDKYLQFLYFATDSLEITEAYEYEHDYQIIDYSIIDAMDNSSIFCNTLPKKKFLKEVFQQDVYHEITVSEARDKLEKLNGYHSAEN